MFCFPFTFKHAFAFSQILKRKLNCKNKKTYIPILNKKALKEKSIKLLINNKIIHVNNLLWNLCSLVEKYDFVF